MADGFNWSRGPIGDEARPERIPRRREAWQAKHDAIFRQVWPDQPKRHFPAPRPEPRPIARTRRKPINWRAILLFLAGLVGGWLLSR